jgi:hypothetical protein
MLSQWKKCLIIALAAFVLNSCGKKDDSEDAAPAPGSWAEAQGALQRGGCAASSCHAAASFVTSEAGYKANQATGGANSIASRLALASSNVLFMPKGGTITAADKAILTNFK